LLPAVLTLLGVATSTRAAQGKVTMTADGAGQTYELLENVFSIEVPDCGHMVQHITEEMDADLHKPVFVFSIHVNQDDDRCGAKDRQRTEIRGKVAEVAGQNGETVYYRWKFKLPVGFQTSSNFTHVFQIKSDAADPVMTLSPEGTTVGINGVVGRHAMTPLAKFVGVWVGVDLKVVYGSSGHLDMTIKRLDNGETILAYSGNHDTWQGNDGGHDPKFGIYRSLNDRSALRDEQVRFADFCISKTSGAECGDPGFPPPDDAGSSTEDPGNGGSGGEGTGGGGTGGEGNGTGGAGASGEAGGSSPNTGGPGGFDPVGAGGSVETGGMAEIGGQSPGPDQDRAGASRATGAINCSIATASAARESTAAGLGLLACAFGLCRRRRRATDLRFTPR
jgi:Polysaccharide lyase